MTLVARYFISLYQRDVSSSLQIQRILYEGIRALFPTHTIVGEEDIGAGCATVFPEPVDPQQWIWTIDPIDGSANWRKEAGEFAIVIGLQQGRTPVLGIAYLVDSGHTIIGGSNWPTTIDGERLAPPKPYNPTHITIAYGLGKRKPEQEREYFLSQIRNVTTVDKISRPGCASASIAKVLRGELDAYLSLKEASTNLNGWLAILANTNLEVNVDLATLNQNEPFCFSLTTQGFAAAHLQPGSTLTKCLEN